MTEKAVVDRPKTPVTISDEAWQQAYCKAIIDIQRRKESQAAARYVADKKRRDIEERNARLAPRIVIGQQPDQPKTSAPPYAAINGLPTLARR